jgi:hypothetical protein
VLARQGLIERLERGEGDRRTTFIELADKLAAHAEVKRVLADMLTDATR